MANSITSGATSCLVIEALAGSSNSCSLKKTGVEARIDADALTGEQLRRQYCSSCHLYPEPGLLEKDRWSTQVLPVMTHRLGIYHHASRNSIVEKGAGGQMVEKAGVFPATQVVSDKDWEKIKKYYEENAPDSLTISSPYFQTLKT